MNETTVATTAGPQRERRRRGLLFPLILITLGAVFLLGNLGYLPPISLRALGSLWPLLLILGGIEMLLARREPFLALGLEIVAVVVGVALVAAQPAGLFVTPATLTSDVSVARDDTRTLSLRLTGGAGTFVLTGGATGLVDARSDGTELRVRTQRRGGDTEVRVDQSNGALGDGRRFFDLFRLNLQPADVRVRVANDVPASIRLSGGAGDFTVDLRDLSVKDVRVEIGASDLTVILTKPVGEVPVRIQAGAARITIEVPEGVEARVATSGGALSVRASNPRFGDGTAAGIAIAGRASETAGYAAAKDRVSVTIEAGASFISIR